MRDIHASHLDMRVVRFFFFFLWEEITDMPNTDLSQKNVHKYLYGDFFLKHPYPHWHLVTAPFFCIVHDAIFVEAFYPQIITTATEGRVCREREQC